MLTELAALETQNRKAAHRDFVAAVWEGALPSQLLPLANAAGLTGDEADALIERTVVTVCDGVRGCEGALRHISPRWPTF